MFDIEIVENDGFVTLKCFDYDRVTIHQSPKWFSQDEIRLLLNKGLDPDYSVTTASAVGMFSELLLAAFRANIDFGINASGNLVFKDCREDALVNIVLISQDDDFIQSVSSIPRDYAYVAVVREPNMTAGAVSGRDNVIHTIRMAHHNKLPWYVGQLASGSVGVVVQHRHRPTDEERFSADVALKAHFNNPTDAGVRKLVDVVMQTNMQNNDSRNSICVLRNTPIIVSWVPPVLSDEYYTTAQAVGNFLLQTSPEDCSISISILEEGYGIFITSSDDEFLTLAATTL